MSGCAKLESLEARRLLATFVVDNSGFENDGDHGAGRLTLAEAVELANADGEHDTIRFAAALRGDTIPFPIPLVISTTVTITGRDGAGTPLGLMLTDFSPSLVPIFFISDADESRVAHVILDALDIHGTPAIFSEESVTVRDCDVEGDTYPFGGLGGAIRFNGDPGASLTIEASNISGRAVLGGAVYASGGQSVEITGSSITGSEAQVDGGALYIAGVDSCSIVNSTIARNATTEGQNGRGGGVFFHAAGATLSISNSTIAENTSDAGGAGVHVAAGILVLNSSIVALNARTDGTPSELLLDGGSFDLGRSRNNLVLDAASAGGLTHGSNANLVGVSPLLGTLGLHGGPTRVYRLQARSPAIDAGHNATGLLSDQRGLPFSRQSGAPDIGAYEVQRLSMVVSSVEDGTDGNGSPGELTLREALHASNGNPGRDSITFSPDLGGATIMLGAQLVITGAVTIGSPGVDAITLDRSGRGRHFEIGAFDGISVTITDLHLRNGIAVDGGAIRNLNLVDLTLERITFEANHATKRGGAVYVHRAPLTIRECSFLDNTSDLRGGALEVGQSVVATLERCAFVGNSASEDGGAIFNDGQTELTECRLTDNSAARGGAIFSRGTLLGLTQSTLSGNTASGAGGAIFGGVDLLACTLDSNSAGTSGGAVWTNVGLTATNCTFSGNTAGGFGGAAAVEVGLASFTFCTIAFNRADADADGTGSGGGLSVGAGSGTGTATADSSIFAHNTGAGGAPDEISRSGEASLDADSSFNLVLDAASAGGLADGENGNIVGQDPLLAALDDNGGPTRTHALGEGSPAVNAADPEASTQTDQRGAPRPHAGRSDIGAFEWLPYSFFSLHAHDDARAIPATDAGGDVRVLVWNVEDDLIVFERDGDGWTATRPLDRVDAPAASGNGVIWTDPATALTSVAGPASEGFIVYTEAQGDWTARNLAEELGVGSDTPVSGLTRFQSRGGLIVIVGVDAQGDIVAFQQERVGGAKQWRFVDISAQLDDQGMETPAITGITSYVTPWNAWNVVGLDASGDIQTVWVHPGNFDLWRVDNLSDITGAPTMTGQLTVTQTRWGAINIGGTDQAGRVLVTWWLPSFGSEWRTSDLTAAAGGLPFAAGNLTGWVSPWGAINYAGVRADGLVAAVWWTPTSNGWQASTLGVVETASTHPITSHQSPDGAMYVFGAQEDGNVFTLRWFRGAGSSWLREDLSTSAERV